MADRTKQTRRQYTAEVKKRAVALAKERGVCAAAHELGIPQSNVSKWCAVATTVVEPPGPGPEPATPQATAPTATASRPAPATPPTEAPTKPSPTRRARVAKVYTPTQIAQALERVAAIGVRPAAKELGISRNALREWERKVQKAAKGDGVAPTSGPDPKTIEQRRDAAILTEWRKQQGLGPSQIRNQLRRAGTKVSVHTVRRVMEEAGYRPPKVERRDHTGDYEAVRPGQLWHMDFVHQYIHKQKVFVLALIDDYSRFVTGWALDDAERADAVIVAFEDAVQRYGKPEAVMSDGGSAFWAWKGSSRFTRVLVSPHASGEPHGLPRGYTLSDVSPCFIQRCPSGLPRTPWA